MNFNDHYELEGKHATFGPSRSSWLRYDDEHAIEVYENKKASVLGTRLHAWAKETIDLGIKQPRSKKTLPAYVNDAIGFRMSTEVVLYFSPRFFGTADSIVFKDDLLRIHDLKTGKIPASMEQLLVYAALFCLEYKVKPYEIKYELRLYQNDEVTVYIPESQEVTEVCDKIVYLENVLSKHESL